MNDLGPCGQTNREQNHKEATPTKFKGLPEIEVADEEIELIEEGGWILGDMKACRYCDHADPKRERNGKIRCKRFSQWVDPIGKVCEECIDNSVIKLAHMDEIASQQRAYAYPPQK